jgi:hypothetical protein
MDYLSIIEALESGEVPEEAIKIVDAMRRISNLISSPGTLPDTFNKIVNVISEMEDGE